MTSGHTVADGRRCSAYAHQTSCDHHRDAARGQAKAAEVIGEVQDHPEDSDFPRRQDQYRAQDRTTRWVDTRYAEPLGRVVDNASDAATISQFAADFCGLYGPFRVRLVGREVRGAVVLSGEILCADFEIGMVRWRFYRDREGKLVAHLGQVRFYDVNLQCQGFSKELHWQLELYYCRSGVDRTELLATRGDARTLVGLGFTWDPDPLRLQRSLDSIEKAARHLLIRVSDEAQDVLLGIVQRLEPGHPDLPELIELENLNTCLEPDLGRLLLHGAGVRVVKYRPRVGVANVADEPVADIQASRGDPVFPRGREDHRAQNPTTASVMPAMPSRWLANIAGSVSAAGASRKCAIAVLTAPVRTRC